jgi:hypothetical protein
MCLQVLWYHAPYPIVVGAGGAGNPAPTTATRNAKVLPSYILELMYQVLVVEVDKLALILHLLLLQVMVDQVVELLVILALEVIFHQHLVQVNTPPVSPSTRKSMEVIEVEPWTCYHFWMQVQVVVEQVRTGGTYNL